MVLYADVFQHTVQQFRIHFTATTIWVSLHEAIPQSYADLNHIQPPLVVLAHQLEGDGAQNCVVLELGIYTATIAASRIM